jgi:hypothetical protein
MKLHIATLFCLAAAFGCKKPTAATKVNEAQRSIDVRF